MTNAADDLLKAYRDKRDFTRTSEPAGGTADGKDLAFVVQKHDATRLHYDFRVEWNGVLKSWAVTRGPSLDPADKRLAVRTEDHPLDYGGFEGTIPEGEYGGGTVMLWDRGTWEPEGDAEEGLARGHLKMRLHGERMRGRWVLVRMKPKAREKRENWLLIKEKDEAMDEARDLLAADRSVSTGRSMAEIAENAPASKKAKAEGAPAKPKEAERTGGRKRAKADALPPFQSVELATLVAEPPKGEEWLHEVKYDGYRVLIAIGGGKVRFHTRNEQDWTAKLAALSQPALALSCRSALIDGEVVAFDREGRADFATLQQALSQGGDLAFFGFDLLRLDGSDLTDRPLAERKEKLAVLLGEAQDSPLRFSAHVRGHGGKVFAGICEAGGEGTVSKRADAPYRGGRNGDWLKTKCTRRQEFVIGGYAPSDKKNRPFASLLVGVFEDGAFHYRGRVGTGFTEEIMADLAARLETLARRTSPFSSLPRPVARQARFVEPSLVAEVEFAELTADRQIRHGAYKGLREDKDARAVTDETPEASKPKASPKPAAPRPPSAKDGDEPIEVAGQRLTHPGRPMFDEREPVTKGDLARHYEAFAGRMLLHAANRPLSLKRCPGGLSGGCFFQKHAGEGFPQALATVEIAEADGASASYMTLSDTASIVAAVQMGGVEFHIGSGRNEAPQHPDRLVFDLDPDEGLGFAEVVSAAGLLREALRTLGLRSFAMVTGGKGVHVVAPLQPRRGVEEVGAFARGLAERIAASDPERFVAVMSKARRRDRIFIDWLRNERGQTAIAPYSVRSRVGAPVAVPVSWAELGRLGSADAFRVSGLAERLERADPWAAYSRTRQSLTEAMLRAVAAAQPE